MSSEDIMAGWRQAIDAGELRFPRCEMCGRWNWYPLPRCRTCGSEAQTWTAVEPKGELYSWTRAHRAFARELVAELPYVTGVVDITAAPGVRLVCLQLVRSEPVTIGAPVRLVLDRLPKASRWRFQAASPP